jgi:hypothetical protein
MFLILPNGRRVPARPYPAPTPEGARRATIRFSIGNVAYLAAIGIAFLSATASLIVSGLVAIYFIFEQTPPGETTTQAGGTPPDTGSGE